MTQKKHDVDKFLNMENPSIYVDNGDSGYIIQDGELQVDIEYKTWGGTYTENAYFDAKELYELLKEYFRVYKA